MDEQPDFDSTGAFLRKHAPGLAWLPAVLRKQLTPAALWSAITALAIAISWLVNAQHDIVRLKESVVDFQKERDDFQKEREVLHEIDTRLAVMSGKVDNIATEVDRQREWRDRIEGIAEAPPHARKRR